MNSWLVTRILSSYPRTVEVRTVAANNVSDAIYQAGFPLDEIVSVKLAGL